MTFLLQPPYLLILNHEGFSSPDPELASLDEKLNKREIAFRSTYNVAESRANDTKRGYWCYYLYIGNMQYYDILLTFPSFIAAPGCKALNFVPTSFPNIIIHFLFRLESMFLNPK